MCCSLWWRTQASLDLLRKHLYLFQVSTQARITSTRKPSQTSRLGEVPPLGGLQHPCYLHDCTHRTFYDNLCLSWPCRTSLPSTGQGAP